MTSTSKYSLLSLKICQKLNANMLNTIRISIFHFNMKRLLQLASLSSSCRDFGEGRKISDSCGIMNIYWIDLVPLSWPYRHSKLVIHNDNP